MSSPAIPPPDETAHLDNLLMAETTNVNNQLGRYVLRFLDADAGRDEPMNADDERALADRVAALAMRLRARADRRNQDGVPLRLICPALPER
jgi:hypothetical protein